MGMVASPSMHAMCAKNERMYFPVRLLTTVALATLLCFVWFSVSLLRSTRFLESLLTADLKISQLSQEVVYLDEVLTMSARLASQPAADTAFWHDRYLTHERQLEQVLQELHALISQQHLDPASIQQTNQANQALVTLEQEAFAHALGGNFTQAQSLLFSDRYEQLKTAYSEGILRHSRNVQRHVSDKITSKRWVQGITLIFLSIIGLTLAVLWIFTLLNIHRWRSTQNRNLLSLKESQETLAKTLQTIEQKNHELERFSYVAAHDLKEPLRSIHSFAQLLETTRDSAEQHQYLQKILGASKRMGLLIDDLLHYTRLDTAQPLQIEPVDMQELLDYICAENLKSLLTTRQARVIYEALPVIPTDRIKITQVLQNLIVNGITYNNSATPEVRIKGEKKENTWEFSIRDNGTGIDARYKDTIFDLFTRAHTHPERKGCGLGLAICQKIMTALGGSIWLSRSNETGSEFRFRTPDAKV